MDILQKMANYDGGKITLAEAIAYARINEADTHGRAKLSEEEFYNKVVEGVRNNLGYSDQYGFSEKDWSAGLSKLGY